ncbi:MAG: hypothetical protein HND51_19560 [Chloroflexi bacterium]|nr:hypothetical protein [Chloroflexota bacterium]
MEIFFSNSDEAPVPPDEVRIRSLEAEPYPDGKRVKVSFAVTPFQQRPNIEINILEAGGEPVAELSVVEALEPSMDFTMHIRQPEPSGDYTAKMRLFYSEIDAYEENNPGDESATEILDKTGKTVDTAEAQFSI